MAGESELTHWRLGKPLTTKQNRALARQYRDGDKPQREAAREAMVRGNQALVLMFAKKYGKGELEHEDMMQEGNIGLLKAIERYDPEQKSFGCYAEFWIVRMIHRSIQNKGTTIHVPAWTRAKDQKEKFSAYIEKAESVVSYGHITDLEDNSALWGREPESQSDEIETKVAVALSGLPENQERAIRLKFGIGTKEVSLKQVGEELGGVSGTRAWQVLREAIRNLRKIPVIAEMAS